jgi:hypothetical protein
MNEYPKMLYGSGWDDLSDNVVVDNEEEEAMAREDGYTDLKAPEAPEEEPEEETEE